MNKRNLSFSPVSNRYVLVCLCSKNTINNLRLSIVAALSAVGETWLLSMNERRPFWQVICAPGHKGKGLVRGADLLSRQRKPPERNLSDFAPKRQSYWTVYFLSVLTLHVSVCVVLWLTGFLLLFSRLYIDGPFGSPSEDVFNYDVSFCVAGGIGVTPFACVLNALLWVIKQKANDCLFCGATIFNVFLPPLNTQWRLDGFQVAEAVFCLGLQRAPVVLLVCRAAVCPSSQGQNQTTHVCVSKWLCIPPITSNVT